MTIHDVKNDRSATKILRISHTSIGKETEEREGGTPAPPKSNSRTTKKLLWPYLTIIFLCFLVLFFTPKYIVTSLSMKYSRYDSVLYQRSHRIRTNRSATQSQNIPVLSAMRNFILLEYVTPLRNFVEIDNNSFYKRVQEK